jgi:hypothetical protein
MTRLDAAQTSQSGTKLTDIRSPLAPLAGPLALAAGVMTVVIGELVGSQALLPPFGILLGPAMAWLGIWMIRTPAAATEAIS